MTKEIAIIVIKYTKKRDLVHHVLLDGCVWTLEITDRRSDSFRKVPMEVFCPELWRTIITFHKYVVRLQGHDIPSRVE